MAEVSLVSAAGAWLVYVAGLDELRGRSVLTAAHIDRSARGLVLFGAEGQLELRGTAWVETAAKSLAATVSDGNPSRCTTPGRPDVAAWAQLIDQVNTHARWDYAVEAWSPPDGALGITLRGQSGVYEKGCPLQLFGVSTFHLPMSFSHAVFRLISEQPADADATFGIELASASAANSSAAHRHFVIARAARFEDLGISCAARELSK